MYEIKLTFNSFDGFFSYMLFVFVCFGNLVEPLLLMTKKEEIVCIIKSNVEK